MSKISHMLIDKIMSWGKYESENRQEIEYAVTIILWDSVTPALSLLATYLFFDEVKLAIIFAISFFILRQFAGGIHAQTHMCCLISTIVIFLYAMQLVKAYNHYFLDFLSLAAWIGVWSLSPSSSKRKRLTISQYIWNTKRAHELLILQALLIIQYHAVQYEISAILQASIIMVFILQLLNEIANRRIVKKIHISRTHPMLAYGFLQLCICICHIGVQNASIGWNYQEELPDDLRRKIENR